VADDWVAVSRAIDERLRELGLQQRELADRSHVSLATVREIHRHTVERRRSPRTLQALSIALGWPPAYLDAVLQSHEPVIAPDRTEVMSTDLAELRGEMREVIELLRAIRIDLEAVIKHVRPDR